MSEPVAAQATNTSKTLLQLLDDAQHTANTAVQIKPAAQESPMMPM
ncbi:hypothetical protein P4S63_25440 [Pseudoalteromonas sp. B193]